MRKVYVLWACTDYEPSTLVGIFASELGAKERLEQIESWLLSRPEWPDGGTESEEDDAWKRLEKWREDNPDACWCETSDRRIVEEFELQGSKPQDVEEFIAASSYDSTETSVFSSDLRAWMTGHVRVPVEPSDVEMEIMVGAFIKEMGGNPEHADAWDGVSAEDKREAIRECGRCIKAAIIALNASKGE